MEEIASVEMMNSLLPDKNWNAFEKLFKGSHPHWILGHHPHLNLEYQENPENPEYPENYPEYLENPENPEYLKNLENPENLEYAENPKNVYLCTCMGTLMTFKSTGLKIGMLAWANSQGGGGS